VVFFLKDTDDIGVFERGDVDQLFGLDGVECLDAVADGGGFFIVEVMAGSLHGLFEVLLDMFGFSFEEVDGLFDEMCVVGF